LSPDLVHIEKQICEVPSKYLLFNIGRKLMHLTFKFPKVYIFSLFYSYICCGIFKNWFWGWESIKNRKFFYLLLLGFLKKFWALTHEIIFLQKSVFHPCLVIHIDTLLLGDILELWLEGSLYLLLCCYNVSGISTAARVIP